MSFSSLVLQRPFEKWKRIFGIPPNGVPLDGNEELPFQLPFIGQINHVLDIRPLIIASCPQAINQLFLQCGSSGTPRRKNPGRGDLPNCEWCGSQSNDYRCKFDKCSHCILPEYPLPASSHVTAARAALPTSDPELEPDLSPRSYVLLTISGSPNARQTKPLLIWEVCVAGAATFSFSLRR